MTSMTSLTSMTSRRTFLASAAAALTSGCAERRAARVAAPAPLPETTYRTPARRFEPVRVSADRVIRNVAGLRPFRPSGFVVRAEKLGEKLLVHNYGHGGGGVSLSWGTAQLAVELVWQDARFSPCAVLGAGAVGLATARLLQSRGGEVTIYAREMPPDTTSNIAGALWHPTSLFREPQLTPEFAAQFERAARFAHRYYQNLAGDEYGVRWIENFMLSTQPLTEAAVLGSETIAARFADLYIARRALTRSEHPFDVPHAWSFHTMLIEPAAYLRAILRDFRIAGGRLVVREFKDRESLAALPERVIVNCTGLGSRDLFGDTEMIPAKGQLAILVPQPAVDYSMIGLGAYMFPRRDGILLGGTFEPGEWSLDPSPPHTARILDTNARIFGF